MRKCIRVAALAASVLTGFGEFSYGQTTFVIPLTNAAENPSIQVASLTMSSGGPRPASFGTATITIAANQSSVILDASITNIDVNGLQTPNDTNDNLTNAHIHASATVTPTTNTGVVWGFHGTPFNDTTPNDASMTPFATGVGGTFHGKWDAPEGQGTTLAAQINNLFGFRAYVNFHTNQFGGGEIRGMIPEPTSASLLLGGAFVALAKRRRKA
jgi:CHRD domain